MGPVRKRKAVKNVYDVINVISGVFMEAVNKAIELGTCLFLDF